MPPPRGAWPPKSPHRASRLHPRPHRSGVQGRQDPSRPARRIAWRVRGSLAPVRPRNHCPGSHALSRPTRSNERPPIRRCLRESSRAIAPTSPTLTARLRLPCRRLDVDCLRDDTVSMTFVAGTIIDCRNATPSPPCESSSGSPDPRETRRHRTSPTPENHRVSPATAALVGSHLRPPDASIPA